MTDPSNRLLQRPDVPTGSQGRAPAGAGGDLLAEVFRSVRLNGSLFFLVNAAEPWITAVPAAMHLAGAVLPGWQHLISYHVVIGGSCWGGITGEAPQRLDGGDILVIPHGAPYFLANPAAMRPRGSDADAVDFFKRMVRGQLPPVVDEGGEGPERTRLVCGFLGCDARPFNPILAGLPPMLRLRQAAEASAQLHHLIAFAQEELSHGRAGSREVLLRVSELLFIEAMRCHVETMPDSGSGWLAGLREPLVARVLSLLHGEPARAWTLAALASAAGASRSVLSERFTQVVGQPPIRYLTAWRMQLAARLLAEPASKVKSVGEAVGYESEAAFSRAFTRTAGSSPVAWRESNRGSGRPQSAAAAGTAPASTGSGTYM